ncbi:molybdenum cofactor biosynthesis protein MoaE [Curtobacterium sp. ISL-83]|uniref:molybdenum cofactor biosynthesis protein MoaE n=1 Tax=Curtobacterium sp. ISL-83 TaxID=2819145 RepID=UPI0027E097D7|nr:molybdenum cofactor biosynthesis protein MoaE [Curtobacterium sp. ISL-83]
MLSLVTGLPIEEAECERFVSSDANGAVVTFRGVIRNHDHGTAVSGLEYSAHPEAERFLRQCCLIVAEEAGAPVAAVHRTGSLKIGDVALFAAVGTAHRGDAFSACAHLVDLIKTRVPIWKRQHLTGGTTEWVGL